MKQLRNNKGLVIFVGVFGMLAILSASQAPTEKPSTSAGTEAAIQARLAEIQTAAQDMDAEKVFSFVLKNDQGALAQNGRLFLTREEALESTRQGLGGLQKLEYRFSRQTVTVLSPTIALAVGEGASSATTTDGRAISTPFVQSVVLVLTNGEWKVFHAHRSFPSAKR